MKRKKILIVLAVIVALIVPFSVFAATSNMPVAKSVRGFFGIDFSRLTDKQKADIDDYSKKMADLQKEFINKMVDNGTMTKEQGDAQIKRIDDAIKNGNISSILKGMGRGGFGGRGNPDGFGMYSIDTSKLTDKQKADLLDAVKKMGDLQKEYVDKLVSYGLFTKEQGTAASKKIDDLMTDIQKNGFSKGLGMFAGGFGGFNLWGMDRIDTSKLTDQQKTDLNSYKTQMTDLRKEVINKLVEDGVLTREQGDAAINMMDNRDNFRGPNGFGKGMRKGGFRGRGSKVNPDSTPDSNKGLANTATPTT